MLPTQARTQLDVARDAWDAQITAAAGPNARAPLRELDSLFEFWEAALWRSGFFGGNLRC